MLLVNPSRLIPVVSVGGGGGGGGGGGLGKKRDVTFFDGGLILQYTL